MIHIGSDTTGGTGYMTRIVQMAYEQGQASVLVKKGQYQDAVYTRILNQMNMLHQVADLKFRYSICKE